MSTVKDDIIKAVDGMGDELEALSRRIHDHPELAYQEVQACAWLSEFLNGKGFKVETGVAGVATAFGPRLDSGAGPPSRSFSSTERWRATGQAAGHNGTRTQAPEP